MAKTPAAKVKPATPVVPPLLQALVLYIDQPPQRDIMRKAAHAATNMLALDEFMDGYAADAVREHVEADGSKGTRAAIAALKDGDHGDDDLVVAICLSASTFALYLGISLAFYMLTGKDGVR